MAARLVDLARIFVGFIRGGLALVNILASTFFGCISGSSVADTASIGSVMIPQMIRNGYPRLFAVNVTIAGSLQPLLIPPSHNAVIYSLAAGGSISIAHLFIAGVIPGVLLGLSLMVLCLIIARRQNFPRGEPIPFRRAVRIVIDAFWGMLTVIIILGGILSGIFTADGVRRGRLPVRVLRHHVHLPRLPLARPAAAAGPGGADGGHGHDHDRVLGRVRLHDGADAGPGEGEASFFLSIADDKYTLLLLINVLLLFLGTFMDLAPMLLICTPIFLPIITKFGIDPVHFGIVMILNLGIGLLTPPVGPTLAVGCAIGKVTMEAVSRSIMVFYVPMLIVLLLVTYLPELSLWLPRLLLD